MSDMNGQNLINEAMQEFWGDPCDIYDEECATCIAWRELQEMREGFRSLLNVSASDCYAIADLQEKYTALQTQDQSDKGGMRE